MTYTNLCRVRVRPIIAYYSKLYSWWSQPSKEEMLNRVRTYLDYLRDVLQKENGIELLEPIVVSSVDDLYDFSLREKIVKNTDILLAINAGLGSQPALIALGDLGLPTVILGLNSLKMKRRHEGFPGPEALDAYGELRRRNRLVKLAVGIKDLLSALRELRCLNVLRNARIISFGTPASYIRDVITPIEYLERKLGVKIMLIPLEELVEEYDKVSIDIKAGKERMKHIIESAKRIAEFKEDYNKALEDGIRLYLAMKHFIRKYNASAVTIDCFGFIDLIYRRNKVLRPPCIALSLLRDEGIPAACEADLDALITMMIMSYISGRPAFMGNPTYMDLERNILRISHCTVPISIVREFDIASFHETGYGATIKGYFSEGEIVTIARVSKFLNEMVIARGTIVRSKVEDARECATRVEIKIKDLSKFAESVVGDHHVLVLGDWLREIQHVCTALGIKPIVI